MYWRRIRLTKINSVPLLPPGTPFSFFYKVCPLLPPTRKISPYLNDCIILSDIHLKMLDDKTFDPKDEFGCRKQEVSFREKNKSKLIRLLFRLDGSNGNHIINVQMGMHSTYPELYTFSVSQ